MKIALVMTWFGRDVTGGAEQQAWQIASRLAQRGHAVEVLTTCCRSHQDDWATNHLPAGVTREPEGFAIRRFPVESRDRARFDRVSHELQHMPPERLVPGMSPVSEEDAEIFTNELIRSPQLVAFVAENRERFDWFIPLQYFYGPVLRAIEIAGDRAAFQPCLHDEAYAYLPQVADAFARSKRLLFNSEGERELALQLFGPSVWEKSRVVGEGVEPEFVALTAAERGPGEQTSSRHGRFVLYLGRKDSGKNIELLLRAFCRFRAVRPNSTLRLVLAGHGTVELRGAAPAAVDLGLVSDAEKEELLSSCLALAQPSEKESFSRVMMEAWFHGKPVAVHSACLATAVAVQQASGGWLAASEEEWAEFFARLEHLSPSELKEIGQRGRRYAAETSDWDKVMERYEEVLWERPAETSTAIVSRPQRAVTINQFLPNLDPGDAISNHTRWIRDQLRALGYQSETYARYMHPDCERECTGFSPDALHRSDAIIYHHSVGTEITPHILSYSGPSCLIYHNITPAEFFDSYSPEFAQVLRNGRDELRSLAPHFAMSYGVSSFNAHELWEAGFSEPGVLPICVTPQSWDTAPDAELMRTLRDGRTNLLFVGRIAPQKRQDDLVEAFSAYLSLDPGARLILVGKAQENDAYAMHLEDRIRAARVGRSVLMPGSVSDAQLAAYYRTANLFWSMSEHEGFCVPLVEAMWFDVPVLAYSSSAIPETLGEAGLMFTSKQDLGAVAALARIMVKDAGLRRKILRAQRERRGRYLPREIQPLLAQLADQLARSVKG